MSNSLLDRERITFTAEVVNVSEKFDNERKREIVLRLSITLDESQLSDDMVGQTYTATLKKERKK